MSDLSIIEKQRKRIRDLSQILSSRRDYNMDVGKHDITLAKAKRLGGGIAAPLTNTLSKQLEVPDEPFKLPVTSTSTSRVYKSILGEPLIPEKTVGLTYKHSQLANRKNINRLFPIYGCNRDNWQSIKSSMECTKE